MQAAPVPDLQDTNLERRVEVVSPGEARRVDRVGEARPAWQVDRVSPTRSSRSSAISDPEPEPGGSFNSESP
jgi:hypothetical protein